MNSMTNMNELMKKVLSSDNEQNRNDISHLQIDAIIKEIVNNTKLIKNCIIFDKDTSLNNEKMDWVKGGLRVLA